MNITVKDVEHVASLARLSLTSEEKQLYANQLNAVLKYVEKLNELDTSEVPPTTHVLPLSNVMREDETRPSTSLELVLKNAPDVEDGQFRVPAVIE